MPGPTGYAFNRTRNVCLAAHLSVAGTYWTRLAGLMAVDSKDFPAGRGLWIVPSHGVHTFAMRFAIDVAYLDCNKTVTFVTHNLKPWRVAPISMKAASVIELPENTLKATGTSVGDEIEITLEQGDAPERGLKH